MQHSLLSGGGRTAVARPAPRAAQAPRRAAPASRVARRCTVAVRAAKHEYQVVKEERSDGGVTLTVTVPGGLVQKRFTEMVDIMRRDVVGPLKGYRADKIPLSEIVSRVGGQRQFKAACLEHVLLKAQEDVMPIHASRVLPGTERITTDVRPLIDAFDPAKPVCYSITFDTLPRVAWRTSYKDIEVEVQETGNLSTDEAAVSDLIRQYRKEKGTQRVVADRGLRHGDVCIIDMAISSSDTGLPLPGLQKERFALDTEADPLGLSGNMEGMIAGEERSWTFAFPDDWHVELWRGSKANAVVKLRELFEWDLPEFNDAFVASHYPSFESADDMRKSLLASTAMERFRVAQGEAADRIMEAVASVVDVEVPESYVMAVAEKEYQEKLLGMVSNRLATPEQVEDMMTEEALGEFVQEKRAELEERCKYLLAVDDIIEAEGLEVEAAGVDEEVARAKEQFASQGLGEFNEETYRADVAEKLRYVAAMQWLQNNVKVNFVPWGGDGAGGSSAAAAAAGAAAGGRETAAAGARG